MIVNSWEETYTQQNGSTVAILLANGGFSVAIFAMPGKLSKPARADGSIVVPPQDVLVDDPDDPSHFTVLHRINIHKSICSPSSVYQHRFSSKILKAQFVGEFPTVVWCFPTLRLLVGFGMMFFHQLRSQGFLWEENIPDREVRTYHDGRLSPKIRSVFDQKPWCESASFHHIGPILTAHFLFLFVQMCFSCLKGDFARLQLLKIQQRRILNKRPILPKVAFTRPWLHSTFARGVFSSFLSKSLISMNMRHVSMKPPGLRFPF